MKQLEKLKCLIQLGDRAAQQNLAASAQLYQAAMIKLSELLMSETDIGDYAAVYGECVHKYVQCNITRLEKVAKTIGLIEKPEHNELYKETRSYLNRAQKLLNSLAARACHFEQLISTEIRLPNLSKKLNEAYAKVLWNIGIEYEIEARKNVKKGYIKRACSSFKNSIQYLRKAIQLSGKNELIYSSALKAVEKDLVFYQDANKAMSTEHSATYPTSTLSR